MPKSFAWIGVLLENTVGTSSAPHGLLAVSSLLTVLTAWLGEVEKPPREEDRGRILGAEGSEHPAKAWLQCQSWRRASLWKTKNNVTCLVL